MTVVETERLRLRRMSADDAGFILGLLNEPAFLRFIGDRGVRTLADARDYIATGPIASYDRFGFGLYLTLRKDDSAPVGICGLLKRDALDDPDVGFALLPRYWSRGYAFEAASAVMAHGRSALGLDRIVAVTTRDNHASIRVLEKLRLRFEKTVRLAEGEPEIGLYGPDPGAQTPAPR